MQKGLYPNYGVFNLQGEATDFSWIEQSHGLSMNKFEFWGRDAYNLNLS
jgi:hypothetical protein